MGLQAGLKAFQEALIAGLLGVYEAINGALETLQLTTEASQGEGVGVSSGGFFCQVASFTA